MTDTNSSISTGVAPLGYVAWSTHPSINSNPNPTMPRTRSEVRDEFARKGWSISDWARRNGYSPNMVIAILADDESKPRLKCLRGDAHNIVVQLGLKAGEVSRELLQRAAA